MRDYITQYRSYLIVVGLAPRTIKIYSAIINKFLQEHPEPVNATRNDITAFMSKRGAARTIKQAHGALNHFYKGVLNSHAIKKIPQPKTQTFVPNILSEDEVCRVINSIHNIKHEAIIQLIYSCALRVSEAINLKIEDISKTKNIIKIVNAKGGRSHYIPIPVETKMLLREYYKAYRPKQYLFQGQSSPKYAASSIRKILNTALDKAGISKTIRVHDLRHSRATHWLENGMDIKFVQKILRHKKLETTERYLHLTTNSLERAMNLADTNIKIRLKYPDKSKLLVA